MQRMQAVEQLSWTHTCLGPLSPRQRYSRDASSTLAVAAAQCLLSVGMSLYHGPPALPQPNTPAHVASPAGFPTRKPFMHFAQRYALLLPDAPANGRVGASRPGSAASAASERSNGAGPGLPLTRSGFIDWFAVNESQVGWSRGLKLGFLWVQRGVWLGGRTKAGPPCPAPMCRPCLRLAQTQPLAPPLRLLQTADLAKRILYASQLDGWQLGKSRVFLRAGQLAQLEVRRWPLSGPPAALAYSCCVCSCIGVQCVLLAGTGRAAHWRRCACALVVWRFPGMVSTGVYCLRSFTGVSFPTAQVG